jgi:D-aminoacyl-tRNA deacylase
MPGRERLQKDLRAAEPNFCYKDTGIIPVDEYTAMRAVVQRVSQARVQIDGEVVGEIGLGLLVLLGITHEDTPEHTEWLADKIVGLRIFEDDAGKMNRDVIEVGGAILVVSQFTLYGDASKGRRPSFIGAARPEVAIPLYEKFIALLRERGLRVETGEFGAMMDVELVNDGPVTLWLEK